MNAKSIGVMLLIWGSGLMVSFYESLDGQWQIGVATIICSTILSGVAASACNDTR